MFSNSWFKKERPILGVAGFGGGATSLFRGGAGAKPMEASGGTVSEADGRKFHLFTYPNSDNFVITDLGDDPTVQINYICCGGGGGGGFEGGGGGGAGAFRTGYSTGVVGTHPVLIGAGGEGGGGPQAPTKYPGNPPDRPGESGSNSTFVYNSVTIFSSGGGGGAKSYPEGDPGSPSSTGHPSPNAGLSVPPSTPGNGSGGGGSWGPWGHGCGGGAAGPTWTGPGIYGYPGTRGSTGEDAAGGGGGFSGNCSPTSASSFSCQTGGNGATTPWIPTSFGDGGYFSGGGAGGGQGTPSTGGTGGGGDSCNNPWTGNAATPNSGGGGGGADNGGDTSGGGPGSHGVLIVSYPV